MIKFDDKNEAQRKLISEWKRMGLSDDEIDKRFNDFVEKDEPKGRSIDMGEAERIIEEIKREKNILRSVVAMVITAAILALIIGPVISIISMSYKLIFLFLFITPILISVVGRRTYHRASFMHRGIGSLISFSWIFAAFFVYHMFGYGLNYGFANMLAGLVHNYHELINASFGLSYGNPWVLGAGVILSALTFIFCEGEIAVHEMNKWSIDNGLGSIEVDGAIKNKLGIE